MTKVTTQTTYPARKKVSAKRTKRSNTYAVAKYKRTPHEKEPFKRFAVYHRLLKQGATKKDLMDAVNAEIEDTIGKSQFYVDMQYMQSHLGVVLAPPEKDGRERIYRYADTYSGLKINEMSADIIEDILKVVKHLKQMEFFSFEQVVNEDISDVDVSDLIVKLSSLVNRTEQEYRTVIDDGTLLDYVGNKYLTLLYDAIIKQEVLEIEYEPFGKSPYSVVIHPYFLKRYNERWFLLGYDDVLKKYTLLALDRISAKPKVSRTKYRVDKSDLREEYFAQIVGVTRRDENEIAIQFRVVRERAYYVATKPIHSTQRELTQEASTTHRVFQIEVIPNRELIQQFLSFGADLEVVAPPVIREQIAEHYRKGSAFYTEPTVKKKNTKAKKNDVA